MAKVKFAEIKEAYEILSDSTQRSRYDQLIFGSTTRRKFESEELKSHFHQKARERREAKEDLSMDERSRRVAEKL